MTSFSRGQGRPVRGFGEFGRSRLLELTREVMKEKPKIDIQRREIAAFAGITPALVSYYFPDKWSLLEAAARPIVDEHVQKIKTMLVGKTDWMSRLRGLIHILVEFNFDEGYLLDSYVDNRDREEKTGNVEVLQSAYEEILSFFEEINQDAMLRQQDAGFVCSALLALCKSVGQQLRCREDAERHRVDLLRERCDDVLRFFLNGAIVAPTSMEPGDLQAAGFGAARADQVESSMSN